MSQSVFVVVNVTGREQAGIAPRFVRFMEEHRTHILDMEKRTIGDTFMLEMLVDIKEVGGKVSQWREELQKVVEDFDLQAMVHDRDREPPRIAILVGREGHCLRQLITDQYEGRLPGKIVGVFSNHQETEPIASAAGLEFHWKTADADILQHFTWLTEGLRACEPDLIVLARYMRILPPDLVGTFRHRVINIHPSLLPHFPGAAPYRQAYDAGVRMHGCTAHFVTEQLDQGPIILQDVFEIDIGADNADDIRKKGYAVEARTLSRAVRMFLNDELFVAGNKVIFKRGMTRLMQTLPTGR